MKIYSKIQFNGNNEDEVKDFIGEERNFEPYEEGKYFLKYEFHGRINELLVRTNDYILELKDDFNNIYFISINENTFKNNESILSKI